MAANKLTVDVHVRLGPAWSLFYEPMIWCAWGLGFEFEDEQIEAIMRRCAQYRVGKGRWRYFEEK